MADKKLYAGKFIRTTLDLLIKYNDSLTDKTDLIKTKNRVTADSANMICYLEELSIVLRNRQNNVRSIAPAFIMALKKLTTKAKDAETIEEVKLAVNAIKEYQSVKFEDLEMYDVESYVDRLDDGTRCDYNRMSLEDARKFKEAIKIGRPYNIFSPTAQQGENMLNITDNSLCETYGLESNDAMYAEAKKVINKMIKGGMHGSKISNDVFDIMHVAAPVSWTAEYTVTNSLVEKKEKSTLRNCIKYLRKDGILIYTMPYTRLTRDMAFVFSKLVKDVQIIKHSGNNLYVHIIGIKDITKEAKQDVYSLLSNIKFSSIPTALMHEYRLASGGIKVPDVFRGSMLDEEDLMNIVRTSGLFTSFIETQNKGDLEEDIKPLLPFNMGQIGLVLTSGCLDGLVKEYDGQYHAIKGMVTKVSNTQNSTEGNDETSIETISNKVQINIVTPDGKFIELA